MTTPLPSPGSQRSVRLASAVLMSRRTRGARASSTAATVSSSNPPASKPITLSGTVCGHAGGWASR